MPLARDRTNYAHAESVLPPEIPGGAGRTAGHTRRTDGVAVAELFRSARSPEDANSRHSPGARRRCESTEVYRDAAAQRVSFYSNCRERRCIAASSQAWAGG